MEDKNIIINSVLNEKLIYLDNYLKSKDLSLKLVFNLKDDDIYELVIDSRKNKKLIKKIAKYFSINYELLIDDNYSVNDLPKIEDIKVPQLLFKLRSLSKYLEENEGLSLARAISYSPKKMEETLNGERKISKKIINRVSAYFSLPLHVLMNDNEVLPLDKLILDDNLLSIQRKDIENEIRRNSSKKSFKRNWNILSYSQRIKVILTSALIIIPLVGYTAYCANILISDRINTTSEYVKEQSLTEEELEILEKQDELLHSLGKEKYQSEVNIGINVAKIKNVTNSGMSFSPTIQLFFDFDHEQYFRTIYNKENNDDFDESNQYLKEAKYQHDDFGYNSTTGHFFKHSDNIPDYMQIEGYSVLDKDNEFYSTSYKDFVDILYTIPGENGEYYMSDETWDALVVSEFEISQIYQKVMAQYPGFTSNNVYPNLETMFSIGHYKGGFDADQFSYEFQTPYVLTSPTGEKEYRYFQSMSFSCTISKIYDNPRYPLDSVSFTIPITAEKLTYEYLKYIPVDYVDLTSAQTIKNNDPLYASSEGKWSCSIDATTFSSGVGTGFVINTGYKLFDSGDIKDISKKVSARYFTNSDSESDDVSDILVDPSKVFYYSEFSMVMHANRSGISLFLQAFINLFAVVIWIVIGFYDQAYHDESAIGMLGTGLFGAISSILVGLSMISDAGIFSLITMINVFTLAVILIMTVLSIASKRAKIVDDKVAIAYNNVRLRVLFFVLTVCTLIMFIGLPIASFMFF